MPNQPNGYVLECLSRYTEGRAPRTGARTFDRPCSRVKTQWCPVNALWGGARYDALPPDRPFAVGGCTRTNCRRGGVAHACSHVEGPSCCGYSGILRGIPSGDLKLEGTVFRAVAWTAMSDCAEISPMGLKLRCEIDPQHACCLIGLQGLTS